VFALLCQRAPIFDENERPMASSAPWAAAFTDLPGALARGLHRGRSRSGPRSFRLTREVRSFRLTREVHSFRLTRQQVRSFHLTRQARSFRLAR
jgi:hypothetical protein